MNPSGDDPRFKDARLYAITDLSSEDPAVFKKIESAYAGGVDIVQLRCKNLDDVALLQLARQIRAIADREEKIFMMNDRPDLAIACGADGVHLGQGDLSLAAARELARKSGRHLWVGKSTHSLDQALQAVDEGADYIGVGPIYKTPTKPDYQAVGLELIREVKNKVKIPFFAIGGINTSNLTSVLDAGARRIAVVRAVFGSDSVQNSAATLRRMIDEYGHAHV